MSELATEEDQLLGACTTLTASRVERGVHKEELQHQQPFETLPSIVGQFISIQRLEYAGRSIT